MSANYKGTANKTITSEYLYNTLKDFKSKNDKEYSQKSSEHSHANKEKILDKFGTNDEGDLTFDGNIVNNGSTAITNHIANNKIHMSEAEKKLLVDAYQKPSKGIPKTDLDTDVQTEIDKKANKEDIIDSQTNKVKKDLMDYSGVDHTDIKNIGTISHEELEQILDNHVSNTIIHQTKSLGQLNVISDDFLSGTFLNCHYNAEEGYIELDKAVTTEPVEYVSDEASYISKVLDTGIKDCSYVTFSWLGKYNSNYTNITAYIRYGAVPTVDSTWTEWQEVPYDKKIVGAAQYCQAKIVFMTSNKFKNIILKNIVVYYGVDIGSELTDARTDLSGKLHPNLKMRLDNMEGKVANSKTLGLVKPDDKTDEDKDYTIPVKVDKNGKLYTVILNAKIDKETKHWIINEVDTGVLAEGKSIKYMAIDDDNNAVVTLTDGSTINIGNIKFNVQAEFLTEDGFGDLRFYNGKFQYYDKENSTWIDASITPETVSRTFNFIPQPMEYIKAVYDVDSAHFKITFKEPQDTYLDGQMLCGVEKIVLVRKEGSEPSGISDGTVVLQLKRKNFGIYKKFPFEDTTITPTLDTVKYYYKAFPISTYGVANTLTENSVSLKAKSYHLYGFKIDQNESNPDSMITYLSDCDNAEYRPAFMDYTYDKFDYGDWSKAWFIDKLKPCMLKYDGTVDYELDKNDYTKKLDGTASDIANTSYGGNAMIGFPKIYWKIVDNGDNTANVYFSDKQVDADFHCWSHIDNNGNEIDYCYMPIYNGSLVSSKLRSLSGLAPMASQTGTNEITYAKANNIGSDIIWYTELFNDRMLVNLLLLLIGKSTYTKLVFGTGNNSSYVSTSNTGVKNTGTMNTKGLFWGNKDNVTGVKVFGMEHWWGNQWRRIGGWINASGTQKIKMTYGISDGSTVDGYNTTGSGYITLSGSIPTGTSGGYINKMLFTENGIIPKNSSGSSTTYYTEGFWFNNSQVDYALVGGASDRRSLVGALSSALNSLVSNVGWNAGASISCKPLA